MFLRCSYFLAKSEADVLMNSVLIKRKACRSDKRKRNQSWSRKLIFRINVTIANDMISKRNRYLQTETLKLFVISFICIYDELAWFIRSYSYLGNHHLCWSILDKKSKKEVKLRVHCPQSPVINYDYLREELTIWWNVLI